jgi:hypothetical protein
VHRWLVPLAALVAAFVLLPLSIAPSAQSDLDDFMKQVVTRRDANWRKLQQYILDEREQVELRGPSGALLWGERRDYTWYIRDGFFVRSPLQVNGTDVGERARLEYETKYLERARRRDARQAGRDAAVDVDAAEPPAAGGDGEAPRDLDGLIRQTRQPQFVSSAYFLRFTFDAGRYALVGREQIDGQDVLRIEYYPDKLFSEESRRERREELGSGRRERERSDEDKAFSRELQRLMNKSSKVTLWIAPATQQILKYTFDDLGWNFFPGQWLAQMDGVSASMTMGQPFPDVWLPRAIDMRAGLALAFGRMELRYTVDYENYRQADVQTRIGIPDRP